MLPFLAEKSQKGRTKGLLPVLIPYWQVLYYVLVIWMVSSFGLQAQSCPQTTGLTASIGVVDGKNSVTLNWDDNPSANRYIVFFRSVGNVSFTQKRANTNSKIITGLSPDTDYEVRVRAYCSQGQSNSEFVTFTSGASGLSCAPPSNLQATGEFVNGYHSTMFSWDPVPEAKFYIVFYRLSGTSRFRQRAALADTLRVNNLILSSIYEWKVRTICEWDQSFRNPEDTPLSQANSQSSGTFCDLPDNLTSNNLAIQGFNGTRLNWSGIPDAAGYFLQYKVNGASGIPWNSVNVMGSTQYDPGGLDPNTLYDFRVQTLCEVGPRIRSEDPANGSQNLDFVNGSFTTGNLGGTCDTPQNLRQTGEVFSGGSYQSTFSWDPVPGADYYRVRYFLGGRVLHSSTSTTNSITLFSLQPEYYIITVQTLCTSDGSIESGWSPYLTFTPSLDCTEPTGLSATPSVSSGYNVADLSWASIDDAMSYEVRYRVVNTDDWLTLPSATNSLRLEFLQSGTDYEWQVRSICSQNGSIVSGYSVLNTFTTLNGLDCEIPDNLRSRVIRNFALLRWNSVSDAVSYDVQIRVDGDTDWLTFTSSFFIVILRGLATNTTYQWRVRSVCSTSPLFASAYSNIESFTTGGGFLFGKSASTPSQEITLEEYRDSATDSPVLSPNPARGRVHLVMNNFETLNNVAIYSSSGNLIRNVENFTSPASELEINDLEPGLYLLRIRTDVGVYPKKLFVK